MTQSGDPFAELVAAMQAGQLDWPVSELGLSAPIRPTSFALDGTIAEFVTIEQLLGRSYTIDEIIEGLNNYTLDAVLIAIAQIMHLLFRHPGGVKTAERELLTLLPSALEQRFHALPVSNPVTERVLTTPQAMLSLAKIALTRHEPSGAQQDWLPPQSIVIYGVAMASHLERDMLEEETYWEHPSDLFVYMFANHSLNAYDDDAAQIARLRALEQLRKEDDSQKSAMYDEVYRTMTGTSPKTARVIASSFWVGSQTGPLLGEAYGYNALVPELERLAAIATFAADAVRMKKEIVAEHTRLGATPEELKSWAFNAFRKYPVVRLSDGRYLVMHPRFLVDHIFDFDYDLRVVWSYSEEEDRQRFRTFRGSAHERLVGMSIEATFPSSPLLSRRVWTDNELKKLWSSRRCDFLVDGGSAILLIEVISHPLNELAVSGVSLAAVDEEIQTMVISKADQLDKSVTALLESEESMLGPTSLGRPIIPIVVATSGFPWNVSSSSVIWRQLKAKGLLQQGRVKPLMVLDIKGVEGMESLAELGHSVTDVILRGIDVGDAGLGFDHLIHRQGVELRRPKRLDAWWPDEFRDMAEGFGFNPDDLHGPPD